MKKNRPVCVLRFAVNVVLVCIILNTEKIENVYGFPQTGIIDGIGKRDGHTPVDDDYGYEYDDDDYGYEYDDDDADYGVRDNWAFQNADGTKDNYDAVKNDDAVKHDDDAVKHDDDAVKQDDDGGKDDDALPDNGGVKHDDGGVKNDDDAVKHDDDGGKDDDAVKPDDDALPDNDGVTYDNALPDDDVKVGDEVVFCHYSYKNIDATMRINEEDFVFVDRGKVIDGESGQKMPVTLLFPGGPNWVQAAVYSKNTNKAYLFKDEKVWAFSANSTWPFRLSENSPKKIANEKSYSPECAIQYNDGTERIFLYKEGHFYIFYPYEEDVERRFRYPVNQYFRGIPSKIDAAISSDEEINFIVNKQAFKMPIHTRTVSKEGKPVESVFNKCKS